MPHPVFWRKLTTEERAALDAEIRRRAYADTHGIAAWLAEFSGVETYRGWLKAQAAGCRIIGNKVVTEFARDSR